MISSLQSLMSSCRQIIQQLHLISHKCKLCRSNPYVLLLIWYSLDYLLTNFLNSFESSFAPMFGTVYCSIFVIVISLIWKGKFSKFSNQLAGPKCHWFSYYFNNFGEMHPFHMKSNISFEIQNDLLFFYVLNAFSSDFSNSIQSIFRFGTMKYILYLSSKISRTQPSKSDLQIWRCN